MTVLNLTPHPIRLYGNARDDGLDNLELHLEAMIPPASTPARLLVLEAGHDGEYELVHYGRTEGLPPERDGYRYVVSLVVALALLDERDDLLVPYEEVRNSHGTVIGCRRLARPV